ncbi:MAG: MFS transporter [Sphingobium sp.]
MGGRPRWQVRLGFFLGAIGPATGFQVVVVLMLRYMTDELAIAAGTAGLVLAATKIIDAILDPLIGIASDRTRTRWGRRRPYFAAGTLLLPASMIAMFDVPNVTGGLLIGFVALFVMLNSIGYSAYTVPYLASAAELTDDYHERSVLMSYRVAGGTVGLMMATTAAPWLLSYWGGGRDAHVMMAWVLAAVVLAVLGLALILIPEPATHRSVERGRIFSADVWRDVWQNRPFRAIIQAHVGFQIGVGAVMVCTAYFSRHVLHVSDVWLGSFLLAKTVGNLASIPFWLWMERRIDKKKAYFAALAAYGLLNLTWLLAGPSEPLPLLFLRMFLIGIAMGGCILLSYSIITDVIRYDSAQRKSQEGLLSGVVSFIDKTFQAVGVAIVGWLLSSMGYVATMRGAASVQPASATTAIYIGFSLIPALAAAACLVAMLGYDLKREDFEPAAE